MVDGANLNSKLKEIGYRKTGSNTHHTRPAYDAEVYSYFVLYVSEQVWVWQEHGRRGQLKVFYRQATAPERITGVSIFGYHRHQ